MVRFLPVRRSDTLLKYRDQVLIIDTKYYEKILRDHYDKAILHSENLYQIFTYVKNLDVTGSGKVLGLLLYARTDETISPDGSYMMGGNKIGVKTLDLNKEFRWIAAH